jgi:hypothetical protein
MKTETIKNWSGLVAIAWMMSVFILIHYVIVPRHIVIGSFWPWIFATLAVLLIPGLILAIIGLRCESRVGRISAMLATGLFLWFVWYAAVPVLTGFLRAAR